MQRSKTILHGEGRRPEADAPCLGHLSLSTTERKRLHSIARTCGRRGEFGGW